jgi:two-component system chemotaxis response regulator CheY
MNPALSVLIVDDSAKMRSMITDIIKRKANKILECSDGMEALGEYSIHHPDWVLMDVKMKNMDGLQATELIHQYFPKAKVMIVSQYNDPEIRNAAQQVGAKAFVSKDNLLDILNKIDD